MIGTNNLQSNTDYEIARGLQFLMTAIRAKQPKPAILLMGILPRRNMEERIALLNKTLARIATDMKITYADAGDIFVKRDGKIDESLFADGLHPNAVGYGKLGAFIFKRLEHLK